MAEPEITKRRVEMRNATLVGMDDDGAPIYAQTVAVDYVRPDFLDAYVADARTRHAVVTVSDEPDAGPGGYHGPTHIHPDLDHPQAGHFWPATSDHPLAGQVPEHLVGSAIIHPEED